MDNWQLISRGKVEWSAKAPNVSSSYGTLESYLDEAAEGCVVIDASEADYGAFADLVVSGPMPDCRLEKN